MEELIAYRHRLLECLAQLPSAYRVTLCKQVDDQRAESVDVPAHDLRKHLSHVYLAEKSIFLPIIRRILNEDTPLLEAKDAVERETIETAKPIKLLLDEMEILNQDLLAILDNLPSSDWNRQGRHPRQGLRTVQWWVECCFSHAKEHLEQVKEAAELNLAND